MENRKLVEDRAETKSPDDTEFSGAGTSGIGSTPDTGSATTPEPAEESDSTATADSTDQNSAVAPNPATPSPTTPSSPPGQNATTTTFTTTPPPAAPATAPAGVTSRDTDEPVEHDGLFGTKVPVSVALVMALVLPAVGYLIGTIGSGKDSSSGTVNAVISPENARGALAPGKTVQFTVLVQNPNDYGAQVTTIEAGRSEATGSGCAEGMVTTQTVEAPRGYIRPNGVRAYSVSATMAPNAGTACENQTFTLPLTVDLESAAG